MFSRWTSVAAVLMVLAAYVHFGSEGSWSFRRVPWERGEGLDFTERYYAGLAEGFLRGRLDLPYAIDARWRQVTNAYDQTSRAQHGLEWEMWDASYYDGRFFLYFSPVPVVLFYLPFRWIARGYPPDALASVFFAAWAFLASVAFARRALAGRTTHVPFAIWVLLIGLGNVVPWTLKTTRAYEVAVMAGMAMTASFAYALSRWTETGAARHAVWMGLWLALAIATRPNLLVLMAVAAFVLLVGRHRWRAAAFALVPMGIVAAIMGAYNFARFDSVFELGMTYQISYSPMWRVPPCSLCDVPEAIRFVNNVGHYVFWAPGFSSTSPYVALRPNAMDPAVSFAGGPEAIGGIGALSPLTLAGAAIAILFALRRGDAGLRAPLAVMGAAWLILAGLSTCRWVTARYALDFMMLMTTATVVLTEHAFAILVDVRTRALALIVGIVAMYAVIVGVFLAV